VPPNNKRVFEKYTLDNLDTRRNLSPSKFPFSNGQTNEMGNPTRTEALVLSLEVNRIDSG